MKKKLNKKGFTLIELIVVIAVIAILAAVLLPRFTGFSKSAKESAVRSNIKNLSTAISAMIAENKTSITENDVKEYAGLTEGTLYIEKVGGDNATGDFYYTLNEITGSYEYESGKIVVPATRSTGSGG